MSLPTSPGVHLHSQHRHLKTEDAHQDHRPQPPRHGCEPDGPGARGVGHGRDDALLGLLQAVVRLGRQGVRVGAGAHLRQPGPPAQRRQRRLGLQRRHLVHVLRQLALGRQHESGLRLRRHQYRRRQRELLVLRLLPVRHPPLPFFLSYFLFFFFFVLYSSLLHPRMLTTYSTD